MSQYLITYFGGRQPSTLEEGKAHFEKYTIWLDSLGDSVVSPANPLKNTHTIKPNGTVKQIGQSQMSGFTVIETGSLEQAIAIAKDCPFLEMDGTLEVSELLKMPT